MDTVERIRATYELRPVDHLFRREFYFWPQAIDRWKAEGMPEDWQERNLFGFDPDPWVGQPVHLGWCDVPFATIFGAVGLSGPDQQAADRVAAVEGSH